MALGQESASSVQSTAETEELPKLDITRNQIQTLQSTLRDLVSQYRGLVTLEKISEQQSKSASERPMVERLHEYPGDGLDLKNLVPYPPQMQPVPVKPMFLDVAWNYIDYPRENANTQGAAPTSTEPATEEKKGGRRGWFSFGR